MGTLALSVAPQLQLDAQVVVSSLQRICEGTQAGSHILVQKAAKQAISIWQEIAVNESRELQSSAQVLEPFLFLLSL